jgi:hypothetical protein
MIVESPIYICAVVVQPEVQQQQSPMLPTGLPVSKLAIAILAALDSVTIKVLLSAME